MTDLFFCPEQWEPDPMISTNSAVMIQNKNFAEKTMDMWQLGSWDSEWTAIISKIPVEAGWLESGVDYRFCFWLNGGENSRADETCLLEIFGDDWEERLQFPLNRDRTKPVLEQNHWLLYAIPFTAPQAAAELTFRFVMSGAVCTISGIPDMNMSACESLIPDERDSSHNQRHNIVFPHGWPNEKPKVVLKARGREVSLSKTAICLTAAAACIAVGSVAAYSIIRKKKK